MKKYILPIVLSLVSIFFANASSATPPLQAIGYWNDENTKSAKPLDLLMDPKTGIAQTSATSVPNTIGSDWIEGGIPQYAVGKVFFSIGRSNYVCSGSIVDDGNPNISIVITAAHCVMDKGKFVTNWAFVPDYDSGNRQFWYAKNLIVRNEVAKQKQFNKTFIEHDWAFAVIPNGTFIKNNVSVTNPSIQLDSLGKFYYSQNGFTLGNISTAFGYPASGIYNGLSLKYAQGPIINDPNGYLTWGMPSDLTGGASGGPWLSSLSELTVSSVNSYKYTNDTLKMYGPKFNAKTTSTFNAAKFATNNLDIIV